MLGNGTVINLVGSLANNLDSLASDRLGIVAHGCAVVPVCKTVLPFGQRILDARQSRRMLTFASPLIQFQA